MNTSLNLTIVILFLLFCNKMNAQNTKYIVLIKNDCKIYQIPQLNGQTLRIAKKGSSFQVTHRENDFVKITEGEYIHRSDIEIRIDKSIRTDIQIDLLVNDFNYKLQNKNKEGLNLNNNYRDFIELPLRDTLKFENLPITND